MGAYAVRCRQLGSWMSSQPVQRPAIERPEVGRAPLDVRHDEIGHEGSKQSLQEAKGESSSCPQQVLELVTMVYDPILPRNPIAVPFSVVARYCHAKVNHDLIA